MHLHIVARGKTGRSPEAELVDRYLKRIAWPTKVTELPDRGGKMPDLPAGSVTIALDERTGRVYLPTSQFGPPATPGGRPPRIPGTFQVLVVGK